MGLKVAVLGCSHTALSNLPPTTREEISKDDHYSWLWHISEINKHIDFHCYALGGAGPILFDYVLKHIIQNNIKYDVCILQLTSANRWILPFNHTDKFTWNVSQMSENLFDYRINLSHLWIHPTSFATGDVDKNYKKPITGILTPLLKKHCFGELFSQNFNESFNQTCEVLYRKFFKRFYYFTAQNNKNYDNIGLDMTVWDYFLKKFPRKFAEEWLTPDLHLNYQGSMVVAKDIIQPLIINHIKKLKSS